MTNPFRSIYDICNVGDPATKWTNLPVFPRMIDLELTSACNFRCLMCPTGNLSLHRPAMFMDDATFGTILAQCARHDTALRFIGWGEPLLHDEALRFIRMANQAGLLTHLNTNGSHVTEAVAARLVEFGLSSIKFSFQGADQASYAEMRNIDWYEGLLATVAMFHAIRGKRKHPWIAVSTTITDEAPETVEMFKERLEPIADEVSVGRTIFDFMDLNAVRLRPEQKARLQHLKTKETVEKRHPVPCPEVYDKLSVHADGSVVVCCNDFDGTMELGNVNETPLAELWRHPKIEAYRERLARQDYDAPLCSTCYDYLGCVAKGKRAA